MFVARYRGEPCPELDPDGEPCGADSEPSQCSYRWDPTVCPFCGSSARTEARYEPGCCDRGMAHDPAVCPRCGGPARYLDWADFFGLPPEPEPAPDWAQAFLGIESSLAAGEDGAISETELAAYFENHGVDPMDRWIHRLLIGICNGARQSALFEAAAQRSADFAQQRQEQAAQRS